MGVTLNLAGYWCIGLPLAYVLGFRMNLRVLGFWKLALEVAAGLQAVVFLIAMLLFDWDVEVQRARSLTARHASAPDLGKLVLEKDLEPGERRPLLVAEV
jgi:MATE family multidrug resistance protein